MSSSTPSPSQTYVVDIGVVEAQQLVNPSSYDDGSFYAYVKFRWRDVKYKTEAVKSFGKKHHFGQKFRIEWTCSSFSSSSSDDDVLRVEVWSSRLLGRNSAMGVVPIALNSLRIGSTSDGLYPLCGASPGGASGESGSLRLQILLREKGREEGAAGGGQPSSGLFAPSPPSPSSPLGPPGMHQQNNKYIYSSNSPPPPNDPIRRNDIYNLGGGREKESGRPTTSATPGNDPSPLDTMVRRLQRRIPQVAEEDIRSAIQQHDFDEEKALAALHEKLVEDLLGGDSPITGGYTESSSGESAGESGSGSETGSSDDDEVIDRRVSGGRRRRHHRRRRRPPSSRPSPPSDRLYIYNQGNSRPPPPAAARSSEEKLKELLPYYSTQQIQEALRRFNGNESAAMNYLLDSRVHELGKTMMAQQLHQTGVFSLHQADPSLNKTFMNFFVEEAPVFTPTKHDDHLSPSLPVGVSVAPQVAPSPDEYVNESGLKKALLIGINYLGSKKELKGCIQDVHRMRSLLTEMYGFPNDDSAITVLTDDSRDELYKPTKKNILLAMKWLVSSARPGDVLFFHFSGHGGQRRNLHGTEMDGLDETLMPLDYRTAGHIIDNDLFDALVAPLRSGVKLTALMDCCHSGSGMDLPFIWNGRKRQWDVEMYPKFSAGDVQLFAGCSDDETSADLYVPSQESGGAMTFALRAALTSNPFGHTYPSLMDQIDKSLRAWGFPQRPQLTSSQKFTFGRPFSLTTIVPNTNKLLGQPADLLPPSRSQRRSSKAGSDRQSERRRPGSSNSNTDRPYNNNNSNSGNSSSNNNDNNRLPDDRSKRYNPMKGHLMAAAGGGGGGYMPNDPLRGGGGNLLGVPGYPVRQSFPQKNYAPHQINNYGGGGDAGEFTMPVPSSRPTPARRVGGGGAPAWADGLL